MSFLTDLFEGKFNKLGTDITHAPSSFVRDIGSVSEWGPLAAIAAVAAPWAIPEIGAGIGGIAGLDAAAGAADAGLTAADLGAAGAADLTAAGGTAADIAAAGGADALATSLPADALALTGDAGAAVAPDAFASGLDLSGGMGMADAAQAAGATPAGFAPTDAELTGGITGTGATATAPAAAGGGGGITGALGDTLKSPWTKLALGALPLGLTLARGEPSLPGQVGPAVANATALAQQGGNLNASQNSVLQQMRQDSINAARQAMFNQGVQNPEADTRWPQWVAQIDSQVSAAAQQMIQQNIASSLQGDAQLIQIAQLQMSSDQAFTNNLVRATTALGSAAGLGGGIKLQVAA